jgi:hypothetical protein
VSIKAGHERAAGAAGAASSAAASANIPAVQNKDDWPDGQRQARPAARPIRMRAGPARDVSRLWDIHSKASKAAARVIAHERRRLPGRILPANHRPPAPPG